MSTNGSAYKPVIRTLSAHSIKEASGDHTVYATAGAVPGAVVIDWGGVLCGIAEEGNEGVHLRIGWESRLEA